MTEGQIVANFDNTVDFKEVKFNFREDKKLGTKRAAIEGKLPVPSVEGLIAIIQAGGKQLDLLLDAAADVVLSQVRNILNDNEAITSLEQIKSEDYSWKAISEIPPKERRGGGIPKETWEEFVNDYIAVMPAVTGKSAEQVGNAAKILSTKFSSVKTAKPIIQMLKGQLAIYTENSPNAEQFQECIQFLDEKADKLLNTSEADLLANL